MVLADEIYCRIVYEGRFESITQFPGMMERTIILDGFSKTYAMTGWRLGYGVMPEPLAAHLARLMTNVNSCTASFTQRAGMEGIRGPQDDVDRMVAEFKRRRDVIVDGLNKIPNVSCRVPRGAFYVFPNIKKINRTGKQIADHLLVEGGVACLAGTCFGSFGEGYLRFSYANSVENIQEGLRRVEKALAAMK
jgi:aspartate/methionine/tyrosine aminotransferase